MIDIRETTVNEVKDVQRLWADGDVMRFAGFPEGIEETEGSIIEWLSWVGDNRPWANEYSIFEDGIYCGQTGYDIDSENKSASLDIKLFAFARGRGVATKALSRVIDEAFKNGAETVWADPHPENAKALALYERLGFERREMPEHVIELGEDPEACVYMELGKNAW